MFSRVWKRLTAGKARDGRIVAGKPIDHPDGPAWHAVAYGMPRPCGMCKQPGRQIRDVRDGILWGSGPDRRFEETGRDVQCDCGVRWNDPAADADAEETPPA